MSVTSPDVHLVRQSARLHLSLRRPAHEKLPPPQGRFPDCLAIATECEPGGVQGWAAIQEEVNELRLGSRRLPHAFAQFFHA